VARIGILGGTFDPPHNGHIAIAWAALDEFRLAKIIFIPAKIPPHKLKKNIAPQQDRINMLSLAVAGHDKFEISDIELHREGPSYTVDTLTRLHQLYPNDELVLLIGADNVVEMETWREPDKIAALSTIAAVNRPGFTPKGRFADKVVLFEMPPSEISSTDIRKKIRAGLPITGMVPEAVEEYILSHRLYT
jgi:nicotinate-nucleotide adenylyltransferase